MKEPRRWLVMCLQKHNLTPDSNNKAGRAAKTLRSTVSTWQVTSTQSGWVCSLISAFTLCSHTQTQLIIGLERRGRSKTATNCSIRDGAADLQDMLPALRTCCHSQTEKVSLSRAWKIEGHPSHPSIPTTAASSRSCQPMDTAQGQSSKHTLANVTHWER